MGASKEGPGRCWRPGCSPQPVGVYWGTPPTHTPGREEGPGGVLKCFFPAGRRVQGESRLFGELRAFGHRAAAPAAGFPWRRRVVGAAGRSRGSQGSRLVGFRRERARQWLGVLVNCALAEGAARRCLPGGPRRPGPAVSKGRTCRVRWDVSCVVLSTGGFSLQLKTAAWIASLLQTSDGWLRA